MGNETRAREFVAEAKALQAALSGDAAAWPREEFIGLGFRRLGVFLDFMGFRV